MTTSHPLQKKKPVQYRHTHTPLLQQTVSGGHCFAFPELRLLLSKQRGFSCVRVNRLQMTCKGSRGGNVKAKNEKCTQKLLLSNRH